MRGIVGFLTWVCESVTPHEFNVPVSIRIGDTVRGVVCIDVCSGDLIYTVRMNGASYSRFDGDECVPLEGTDLRRSFLAVFFRTYGEEALLKTFQRVPADTLRAVMSECGGRQGT